MNAFLLNTKNLVLDLLTNTKDLNVMQRGSAKRIYNQGVEVEDQFQKTLEIIREKGRVKNPTILLNDQELIIYSDPELEYTHNIYVLYKNDNLEWVNSNMVSDTFDKALIGYLSSKYDTNETSLYIMRLLNIKP